MAALSQNSNNVSKIQVEKLNAPLGAKITGVDFSQPIDDDAREFLKTAWSDHLILIFKGQQHISQEQHIEATRVFGFQCRVLAEVILKLPMLSLIYSLNIKKLSWLPTWGLTESRQKKMRL